MSKTPFAVFMNPVTVIEYQQRRLRTNLDGTPRIHADHNCVRYAVVAILNSL